MPIPLGGEPGTEGEGTSIVLARNMCAEDFYMEANGLAVDVKIQITGRLMNGRDD
jgi:hypothetical protein